jgi:hypothetical protein
MSRGLSTAFAEPSDCGDLDSFGAWGFLSTVDISLSHPVKGIALSIGTLGKFDISVFNSNGDLLEINSAPPLSGILHRHNSSFR